MNGQRFRAKPCRTCAKVFTPAHPCNLYCSPACKGKTAYYERNYGITQTQLEEMKKAQGFRCFLCDTEGFVIGKNQHTEKLAVDHCHKTGKVRKLLCHNCNRALGLMKDDPDLLRRAASYVETFQ